MVSRCKVIWNRFITLLCDVSQMTVDIKWINLRNTPCKHTFQKFKCSCILCQLSHNTFLLPVLHCPSLLTWLLQIMSFRKIILLQFQWDNHISLKNIVIVCLRIYWPSYVSFFIINISNHHKVSQILDTFCFSLLRHSTKKFTLIF